MSSHADVPTDPLLVRVREEVGALVEGDGTGHAMDHVDRVVRLARTLGRAEGADPLVVEVAALCHDLHRVVEREEGHVRSVHPAECADRVQALLAAAGAPAALAPRVLEAVDLAHRRSFSGHDVTQGSLEADVLHDADDLDAMGAVGIGRAFMFGGAHGEPMWVPGVEVAEQYRSGSSSSIVQHFHEKLLRLRDDMRTASGRELAAGRHATLERFLADFEREWAGAA